MIRVYDEAGNVIETYEQAGEFKEWLNFWARGLANFGSVVSPGPDNKKLMLSFCRDPIAFARVAATEGTLRFLHLFPFLAID